MSRLRAASVKLLSYLSQQMKQRGQEGERTGAGAGALARKRGVKITVTKLDKLSSESQRPHSLSQFEPWQAPCAHPVHPVEQIKQKKKKEEGNTFLITSARLGKQMKTNAQRL